MVMRMGTENINTLGRVTQGVRLIRLKDDNNVATICLVDKEKDDSEVINNEIEDSNSDSLGKSGNIK